MNLPRFRSGQPLGQAVSARVLNEMARGLEQQAVTGGVAQVGSPLIVQVKNASGAMVGQYCPIGVGQCLSSLSDGTAGKVVPELLFNSSSPTVDSLWGITQQVIENGRVGRVLIAGPSWLRMRSRTLVQPYAEPANQYTHCVGAASGRFTVRDGVAVSTTTRFVAGVLLPSGGSVCTRKYTLDIYCEPIGGTFAISIARTGGAAVSKTFNYNWTPDQVKTQICTYSSSGKTILTSEVEITGGDLPSNRQIIVVPDDVTLNLASPSGANLTRQGLAFPSVRLSLCCS